MFSSGSPFSYALLEQEEDRQADPKKKIADWKFVESQYQRNLSFLNADIAVIENKIAATLITKQKAQYRFQRATKHLFATYQKMTVFNFYRDSPEVARVKQRLLRFEKRLVKVSKSHMGLFNSLSDKELLQEQQEAGLAEIKKKIAALQQTETIIETIQLCTYQPPRL